MPSNRLQNKSTLGYILSSLMPYSRANLQLSFHTQKFFNDLERISGRKRPTLQTAIWRAEKSGLIEREGKLIRLTARGLELAQPFTPRKLKKKSKLMIIFDVPEHLASRRRRLRRLLKQWNFHQVQKSVWASEFDYSDVLAQAIQELELDKHVRLYECARLYPGKKLN